VLTLLPELLAWRVAKRQQQTKQQQLNPNCENSTNGQVILSGERLLFRLDTMGCASCVSTVSILLDGLEGVMSHKVSLEDGLAEVLLAKSSSTNHVNNNTNSNSNDYVVESSDTKHDTLSWKDIAAKLEAAGFPVKYVEEDSKKHR
jgi:copper chaperone CopZ